MAQKISTRGSGAKKGPQKYQNEFAYKHNKGSKTTKKILDLPVDGLCKRCTDQVVWRKQFRKYKPLTAPKKCVSCDEKKVKKAYHVLCDDCANTKGVCAKCMDSSEVVDAGDKKTSEYLNKEEQELENKLADMQERQRRTYLRKLERGEIEAADIPAAGSGSHAFDFTDSEFESSDDSSDEKD
ncbi:hypothetical protein IW140_001793 [Coemansia sp. RSA 1813]|nr:hypothetical protein EV178_002575 [Coemansia sp. RSA 1646]KAJ1769687.1 hypothetical protein LPJ74_003839 [Coemansia sp. RSA 1843]KAJ2091184.1 hypothetical protein IW138_002147 [Coemansia sp. RSA 986]KAJ2211653.1 hypothetical protein EV179_005325 [Coemansia sp. RSA 487]KAJ2571091.1 hypothetical protein IW140_001793 [Coemansia sp. RSA 1813]